ncbi:hypothetical protein J1N35_022811 [Gossypium stocksii]|uniref:Uncharacterized protein n=1 Tax=Gossypium stocksii TaxID=47602 RepID=A0A9D4A3A6_9ROSI|nr:hypothetical protein J1N35_022811 [Gossypium stocksii]
MINMVKERLDKFLVSADAIENMLYLATKVVRQSKSDHYAILMNMMCCIPHENFRDSRMLFKYNVYWAKENEARDIIKRIWTENNMDILDKVERVRENLGLWQYNHYRRINNQIHGLVERIDKLVDGPNRKNTTNLLKSACFKLGHLYAVEEGYWAQRARIKWLMEGDRNTHYFHMRAISRRKKNNIDRLKDSNGTWQYDKSDICKVTRDYFHDLFKSTSASNNDPV